MLKDHTHNNIQEAFVRVCQDSGWKMSHIDAAIFTAKVLNIHPLEVWIAFSSLDAMAQIANHSHPYVAQMRK